MIGIRKIRSVLLIALGISGVVLYAFPTATIPYVLLILLHVAFGVAMAVLLLPVPLDGIQRRLVQDYLGWGAVIVGAAFGIALIIGGALRPHQSWLNSHIAFSAFGLAILVSGWLGGHGWLNSNRAGALLRNALLLTAAAGLGAGAWAVRTIPWQNNHRVENPVMPPAAMTNEGDGPGGHFFPSSAQTSDRGVIPSKYFMQSQTCQRCHRDIYEQWASSMHHFSSFNNQWYRKSIEYMQEVNSVQSTKWCAGCHDPAMLFSGMFDTPVGELIDKPESQIGLGCVMCHSIQAVKSTMGQGDYSLEYPKLNELATSENPLIRAMHDFVTYVNPEPHRRTFLKPFVRSQTADFCSACHKVHLDVPVNNYRWIRGFNDYDNWQASGVSGLGARSFYYPPKPQRCVDCHMPMIASGDVGNIGGKVHSHRFAAANTAVAIANEDKKQLEETEKFLKDNIVSVDIFAISPALPAAQSREAAGPEFSTLFAVGEEAETSAPRAAGVEVTPITAPLNRTDAYVRRGDEVRVDVVARTRKVGHFFPGGTVDAFDVWIELIATDENGKMLFWSGMAEDNGRGPVEKGAHFYRSLTVDEHGNPINKRNAWAGRALVYVRLIPPGAADTVHYRLKIPSGIGNKITIKVRMNYRKFAWWHTQFAYAGAQDPSDPNPQVSHHYDDRRWVFTGDTSKVSGKLKRIPDVPTVTLAEDQVTVRVAGKNEPAAAAKIALNKDDWTRWNDYGIGLLAQGDLKAAENAFRKITEIDPTNPDGWVNIGRVRVQEGNMEGAKEVLEKALKIAPGLARAQYFYSRVLKAEGRYDEAAAQLRDALRQYPRDRVVRNELGRVLFLQKRYQDAVKEFEYVLTIDPEDLQAHYNLMLCYNGLGQEQRAMEHQRRYMRFKADESAQSITGQYRLTHPEDNNERQAIHEHISVPLENLRNQ